MAQHVNMTEADLHVTKGVAAATNSMVHVKAAGAGTWALLTTANFDTASITTVNRRQMTVTIADVSTASFVLIPLPKCTFVSSTLILGAAITVADSVVTFTNSTGPTVCGTKTITFTGSAEGTTFTFTPGAGTAFAVNTYLKIATDGGSTTVAPLYITIIYDLVT